MLVVYPGGVTLTLTEKTFEEMVRFIHEKPSIKDHEPMYVYFPAPQKHLVYDKNLFEAYLKAELKQEELIERTECDGLYRNKYHMQSEHGDTIEPGCLWKRKGLDMMLVNDEDFALAEFFEESFDKV